MLPRCGLQHAEHQGLGRGGLPGGPGGEGPPDRAGPGEDSHGAEAAPHGPGHTGEESTRPTRLR